MRANMLSRAIDNAVRQGCECYAPRAILRSERSRRLVEQPLFPGYLFVRPAGEHWMFLRSTFGVLDVLMGTSERPATLPQIEIDRIRAREDASGLVVVSPSEFAAGESVNVYKGAVSLSAVVEGMIPARDRVMVLMNVLGRWTRTEVDVGDVTRA